MLGNILLSEDERYLAILDAWSESSRAIIYDLLANEEIDLQSIIDENEIFFTWRSGSNEIVERYDFEIPIAWDDSEFLYISLRVYGGDWYSGYFKYNPTVLYKIYIFTCKFPLTSKLPLNS